MNLIAMLFDIAAPSGTVTAAAVGIGFFFALVAVAYIIFRLLRKTVKMAFRMAIVAVILAIAVVGSASLWWFGSVSSQTPRPRPSRQR